MTIRDFVTCAGLAAAIWATTMPADAAASFKTIYDFTGGADSLQPAGGLVVQNGILYGATLGTYAMAHFNCKSPNCGTIFAFNLATLTLRTLHDFNEDAAGYFPGSGLTASHGTFYGIDWAGGTAGYGAVFSYNPANGAEKVIDNLAPNDASIGFEQMAAYKQDMYLISTTGTTPNGTSFNGTVIKVNAATGKESILYAFKGWDNGSKDGWYPISSPIFVHGQLYGTTVYGGQTNNGTLFQIDPSTGKETVLYSFTGGADGKWPSSNLAYKNGILYGTTVLGGKGYGTVFRFDLSSDHVSTLHQFTGGRDGGNPGDPLFYKGQIYLSTVAGGNSGWGVVAQIDVQSGKTSVVHSFSGESDGVYPGNLVLDHGVIYGLSGTEYPFVWNGTLFQITP